MRPLEASTLVLAKPKSLSDSPYNPQLEGDPFLWEGGPTGVLIPNSQHYVIIDRERELVNQLTLDFLRHVGA